MLWFELSKQLRKTWQSPGICVNLLTVDSHFMHVYSCEVLTLFYETLLREKKILVLGFYQISPRRKNPEPLINLASLSKSVKNIRILCAKVKRLCLFLSYFSAGKSQGKYSFVQSQGCSLGLLISFSASPLVLVGDSKLKTNLEWGKKKAKRKRHWCSKCNSSEIKAAKMCFQHRIL